MTDRELHKQKLQAQLDEWKADIAKLRARAAGATADAQLTMNKQVGALEHKLVEAQAKMVELGDASEDAWHTVKQGADAAWETLTSAFGEARTKFQH